MEFAKTITTLLDVLKQPLLPPALRALCLLLDSSFLIATVAARDGHLAPWSHALGVVGVTCVTIVALALCVAAFRVHTLTLPIVKAASVMAFGVLVAPTVAVCVDALVDAGHAPGTRVLFAVAGVLEVALGAGSHLVSFQMAPTHGKDTKVTGRGCTTWFLLAATIVSISVVAPGSKLANLVAVVAGSSCAVVHTMTLPYHTMLLNSVEVMALAVVAWSALAFGMDGVLYQGSQAAGVVLAFGLPAVMVSSPMFLHTWVARVARMRPRQLSRPVDYLVWSRMKLTGATVSGETESQVEAVLMEAMGRFPTNPLPCLWAASFYNDRHNTHVLQTLMYSKALERSMFLDVWYCVQKAAQDAVLTSTGGKHASVAARRVAGLHGQHVKFYQHLVGLWEALSEPAVSLRALHAHNRELAAARVDCMQVFEAAIKDNDAPVDVLLRAAHFLQDSLVDKKRGGDLLDAVVDHFIEDSEETSELPIGSPTPPVLATDGVTGILTLSAVVETVGAVLGANDLACVQLDTNRGVLMGSTIQQWFRHPVADWLDKQLTAYASSGSSPALMVAPAIMPMVNGAGYLVPANVAMREVPVSTPGQAPVVQFLFNVVDDQSSCCALVVMQPSPVIVSATYGFTNALAMDASILETEGGYPLGAVLPVLSPVLNTAIAKRGCVLETRLGLIRYTSTPCTIVGCRPFLEVHLLEAGPNDRPDPVVAPKLELPRADMWSCSSPTAEDVVRSAEAALADTCVPRPKRRSVAAEGMAPVLATVVSSAVLRAVRRFLPNQRQGSMRAIRSLARMPARMPAQPSPQPTPKRAPLRALAWSVVMSNIQGRLMSKMRVAAAKSVMATVSEGASADEVPVAPVHPTPAPPKALPTLLSLSSIESVSESGTEDGSSSGDDSGDDSKNTCGPDVSGEAAASASSCLSIGGEGEGGGGGGNDDSALQSAVVLSREKSTRAKALYEVPASTGGATSVAWPKFRRRLLRSPPHEPGVRAAVVSVWVLAGLLVVMVATAALVMLPEEVTPTVAAVGRVWLASASAFHGAVGPTQVAARMDEQVAALGAAVEELGVPWPSAEDVACGTSSVEVCVGELYDMLAAVASAGSNGTLGAGGLPTQSVLDAKMASTGSALQAWSEHLVGSWEHRSVVRVDSFRLLGTAVAVAVLFMAVGVGRTVCQLRGTLRRTLAQAAKVEKANAMDGLQRARVTQAARQWDTSAVDDSTELDAPSAAFKANDAQTAPTLHDLRFGLMTGCRLFAVVFVLLTTVGLLGAWRASPRHAGPRMALTLNRHVATAIELASRALTTDAVSAALLGHSMLCEDGFGTCSAEAVPALQVGSYSFAELCPDCSLPYTQPVTVEYAAQLVGWLQPGLQRLQDEMQSDNHPVDLELQRALTTDLCTGAASGSGVCESLFPGSRPQSAHVAATVLVEGLLSETMRVYDCSDCPPPGITLATISFATSMLDLADLMTSYAETSRLLPDAVLRQAADGHVVDLHGTLISAAVLVSLLLVLPAVTTAVLRKAEAEVHTARMVVLAFPDAVLMGNPDLRDLAEEQQAWLAEAEARRRRRRQPWRPRVRPAAARLGVLGASSRGSKLGGLGVTHRRIMLAQQHHAQQSER